MAGMDAHYPELRLYEPGKFCLGEIPCGDLPSRTLFIVITCHLKISVCTSGFLINYNLFQIRNIRFASLVCHRLKHCNVYAENVQI